MDSVKIIKGEGNTAHRSNAGARLMFGPRVSSRKVPASRHPVGRRAQRQRRATVCVKNASESATKATGFPALIEYACESEAHA